MVVEIGTPDFHFKYTPSEKVLIGKCEWCGNLKQLPV